MPQTYSNTDLGQKLIAYRRELHEYPELSFEEYETTKKLKRWLTDAGIELLDLPLKTGVLAVIRGNKPGPVIGLRADIDALPVQETTGLPFASKVPGKMHACGHDFHTASILGAALLLNEHKADLEGTVKIIFQPAEENGGGGRQVVDSGVLDDARAVFGMHDMPDLPTGTIGIKGGQPSTASLSILKASAHMLRHRRMALTRLSLLRTSSRHCRRLSPAISRRSAAL